MTPATTERLSARVPDFRHLGRKVIRNLTPDLEASCQQPFQVVHASLSQKEEDEGWFPKGRLKHRIQRSHNAKQVREERACRSAVQFRKSFVP